MKRIVLFSTIAASALPAFAAETEHGAAGGHDGGGFLGGLAYAATDPVTFTAFLALCGFVAIAWRMGAFKTVLGGLDARADAIRKELEEAASLREQAADALAAAERKAQDADKEAEAMIEQAKADAKRIMEETRKDIAERLARREALAEARIARAEAEATEEVRRAAADAATEAARRLLAGDTAVDQFEKAAREIEKALTN
jgi:F-type H+-transporting ATPase subunit b